ncbi:MAG: hypothetical protein AABY18_01050 [Candidatus Thermoplasmatota archaeon]
MNLRTTWPALMLLVGLVVGGGYAVFAQTTGDSGTACIDADPNEAGHQDADESGDAAETAEGAEDGPDQGPDADPNEPGHQDADDSDDKDDSDCGENDASDDEDDAKDE